MNNKLFLDTLYGLKSLVDSKLIEERFTDDGGETWSTWSDATMPIIIGDDYELRMKEGPDE